MAKQSRVDNRPTMAEWPVKIWAKEEFPTWCLQEAEEWMQGAFEDYRFVYAPKRRTDERSYEYVFGYGKEQIFYKICGRDTITLPRSAVSNVRVKKELLNVVLSIEGEELLHFPYVASTYYLYDPFLNWLLGLEESFQPAIAEQEYPRPQKLYEESLVMYNFSLGAYRLGSGFETYAYEQILHRHRLFPWKKSVEESLKVEMERGIFHLYSFKYLTEYVYELRKTG